MFDLSNHRDSAATTRGWVPSPKGLHGLTPCKQR